MQGFALERRRDRRRESRFVWIGTTALVLLASPAAWGQAPPNQPQGTAPTAPPQPPPTRPTQVPQADTPPNGNMPAAPAGGGTGGTNAEQVATRAAQTSYQAKAATQTAASASARADGSWANFIPRITLTARYTRLSNFTAPSLGSGAIVATDAPPGPINPTTANFFAADFSFPLVLDNYLLQASIQVPISDYFLKINQTYTAATQQAEAASFDVTAARAKSYADGKIAYYMWIRARESKVVADQSLQVAQAHAKDAQNQFSVGNASRADVLRAETQVAAAELTVERAKSGIVISERQIRIAMHAPEEEVLTPGETLDGNLPPVSGGLKEYIAEGQSNRPELKSLDRNATAARKLADASRNGRYPALSAFADGIYANPNPRRFPATPEWFPTWQVGAQITWSPNDLLTAGPAAADAEARAAGIEAQKQATKDGIELEVTQAYQSVVEADVAIGTTKRQLASAEEAYRVARELFNAGRGTSTTLIDAENALAASRFDHLNAKSDARMARIRLEHAVGRDAKSGN